MCEGRKKYRALVYIETGGYQLKIDCNKYKIFYISLTVNTKQKLIIDTQKIKRQESKHTTTEKHQVTKEEPREEERNKGITKQPETMNKMVIISPYLSIITLHVNELNSPIKRQGVWLDKKQDPSICCLQENHFRAKDTHRLKGRE